MHNEVSVIIPFKNSGADRYTNLLYVLNHLFTSTDFNIVICEQGTSSDFSKYSSNPRFKLFTQKSDLRFFGKSECFNFAVKNIKSEYLVLLDADIVIDLTKDFIVESLSKYKVVYPFNSIIDLTPEETLKYFSGELTLSDELKDRFRSGTICTGGVLFLKRSTYLDLGGFNEAFKSWGLEDDSFFAVANKKYPGEVFRYNGYCIHLAHELAYSQEYKTSDLYLRNNFLYAQVCGYNEKNISEYCIMQKILNKLGS
jgi:glycosyltransferase involved in cell wall biosynthesis